MLVLQEMPMVLDTDLASGADWVMVILLFAWESIQWQPVMSELALSSLVSWVELLEHVIGGTPLRRVTITARPLKFLHQTLPAVLCCPRCLHPCHQHCTVLQ